jgi:hypothetical protein
MHTKVWPATFQSLEKIGVLICIDLNNRRVGKHNLFLNQTCHKVEYNGENVTQELFYLIVQDVVAGQPPKVGEM